MVPHMDRKIRGLFYYELLLYQFQDYVLLSGAAQGLASFRNPYLALLCKPKSAEATRTFIHRALSNNISEHRLEIEAKKNH